MGIRVPDFPNSALKTIKNPKSGMPEGTHCIPTRLLLLVSDTWAVRLPVIICCPSGPLADGHLLDHVGLARRTSAAGANATTGLLLKDLPELERLIGSYDLC